MNEQSIATAGERQERFPRMMRVGEVADVLGLSGPSVYRLMEAGRLPYVILGRCRRVKEADVLALIERSTVRRE